STPRPGPSGCAGAGAGWGSTLLIFGGTLGPCSATAARLLAASTSSRTPRSRQPSGSATTATACSSSIPPIIARSNTSRAGSFPALGERPLPTHAICAAVLGGDPTPALVCAGDRPAPEPRRAAAERGRRRPAHRRRRPARRRDPQRRRDP